MKRICIAFLILAMLANVFTFVVFAEEKTGVCGDNLTWILDDEGTLTISGTGEMYNFELVYYDMPFPEGYYTCPWDYRELVKKVVIEDGVTSIGSNAFNCLDRITEVILPDSLKSIGDFAFATCSSLQDISIPSSVDEFGEGVFADTPFLKKEFNENDGGLYINDILVQADTSREGEFLIKDGTKSISLYAFWTSYCIESLFIPESVETLSANDINSIMTLKQVVIDENNPYYTVDDGAIFSKDKTELIYYTLSKEGEYTIPGGVRVIAPKAFSYSSLDSIIFSDSVEEIGAGAFFAAAIESISISNAISVIPDRAFDGCWQLKDVYYEGTEEEWNNIAIGEENAELLDAVIHYLKVEETEKASDTEKTTESESISEENLSVDTVVNDATPPKPDNKPKYESKQTGDPIVTLNIISALAFIIGTITFAIFIAKKEHQKKSSRDQ